jgi:signal transduction histidine kinase
MITRRQLRESWRAFLSADEARLGPWWMAYVWTIVFAMVCAFGFTLINISLNFSDETAHLPNWWRWFQANMVISLVICLTIRLLFTASGKVIGKERLRGWSKPRRSFYYSVVPIIGVSVAWPLTMLWVVGVDVRRYISVDQPGSLIASIAFAILITGIFTQFFQMKTRQIQAENRATEAQLRLLQAQIEPHFLFNTLANVVSLMQTDTPRAQAMLESFVDYLRASLTGFSHGSHTLGDEMDLVEAYMRIVKMRMEDRLQYEVDVPAELRKRSLPALTLQPLVENAIVHGIEPQISGGTIRIAARLERDLLVLTVQDDGAGMTATPATAAPAPGARSSGTALGNIRERLRQAYGATAALQLDAIVPHGVRARLSVPAAT